VEVIDERVGADGSRTVSLLYEHQTSYYVGPIPLGRYPIAVLSGLGFAASVGVWIVLARVREQRKRWN
jgi:hypothetical protein